MRSCLIVSGGEYAPLENNDKYDCVIACDRGYENALKMGLKPDLVIGDFDSCGKAVEDGIQIQKLSPIKDDTDTISAVKYALKEGYKNITVCCAFGGRFDHSYANVQTALYILEHGVRPVICGSGTELYAIHNGSIRISKKEGCYLSVFSASDKCEGVSISGTAYELSDAALTNSYPLGVSNEWTADEAQISVKSGTLVVVISKNTDLAT